MNEWHDFYVAVVGAAAALAGLIFVAISINLTKILENKALPYRAIVSLAMLIAVLVISIIMLVPGQSIRIIGIEINVVAGMVWLLAIRVDVASFKLSEKEHKPRHLFNLLFDQISILPYLIGGFCMIFIGESGLYWIVPAVIFSFIKSTINAWILLIEINR